MKDDIDLTECLMSRVEYDTNGGCWFYSTAVDSSGYGRVRHNRRSLLAHRASWEAANRAAIPAGMVVRHKCDVSACINPDHLEIGTHADNTADAIARGRHRPGRYRILSPATVTTMMDRHAEGWSPRRIAEEIGFSRYGVSRRIKAEKERASS